MSQPRARTSEIVPLETGNRGNGERMVAKLALLSDLETSLRASRRALLAGDFETLELTTSDQRRFHAALVVLGGGTKVGEAPASSGPFQELALQVRGKQVEVLALGQVQAALLVRARQWLRILENLVAGPEQSYVAAVVAAHPATGPRVTQGGCRCQG